MRIEISEVLVEEHRQRLREAAQPSTRPFASRLWAFVTRRPQPAATVGIRPGPTAGEIDRLAA
jgi:hypothetical protein